MENRQTLWTVVDETWYIASFGQNIIVYAKNTYFHVPHGSILITHVILIGVM
jgi:hypothetical protein